MAGTSAKRSGGRDWVMGGRHLVAAFVIVVLLCGVFFALGYVMGQAQQQSEPLWSFQGHKKPSSAAAAEENKATGDRSSDWDFYSLREPGKTPAELPAPAAKPAAVPAGSSHLAPGHGSLGSPPVPRGALVLQVAALRHETDALALANLLQQKNYPAFVLPGKSDKLYRVQVGPYSDTRLAEVARRALEREGFKTILKR